MAFAPWIAEVSSGRGVAAFRHPRRQVQTHPEIVNDALRSNRFSKSRSTNICINTYDKFAWLSLNPLSWKTILKLSDRNCIEFE